MIPLSSGRLNTVDLAAGETLTEGGGRLAILRRGHARVLVPDFAGRPTPAAELGPGDAFGVAALLGQESGAVLEAVERVGLVVLDDEAMSALAATTGRGRASEWIAKYGDPRDPKVDIVDWIERLPISETRFYVQRVMENMQVYQALAGGNILRALRAAESVARR